MLHPTPESFEKDLELLSQRLQALREEFRERDLLSDAHKAIMDRMQQEKERLSAKLAEVESKRANWDLIRAELAGAWNSFVADVELLKLRLMDAETTKERKPERGSVGS
jgi:chromosome segregation ATPase